MFGSPIDLPGGLHASATHMGILVSRQNKAEAVQWYLNISQREGESCTQMSDPVIYVWLRKGYLSRTKV